MRQRLINGLFPSILCLISSATFAAPNHLAELKSKFPFGLLSDDYGILSVNDLAMNACDVEPKKFNPEKHHYNPYEYWQCFESKSLSFICDSSGVPDEHEGIMGLVIIKASVNHIHHEYLERRPWPIKDCKGFLKDAADLLKGVQYACISGSFIENEIDHSGHQTTSWVFERLKTKKGCEGHDCEFTKKYKQENCPNIRL
ncbi:MAG TPA: hypothetical protein VN132_01505 [Bdellovibrio sp.]|nr:hypothetical protein [Bdellovibrio sp.]